jgi:soluble lytic murein transglycosylase-like protein
MADYEDTGALPQLADMSGTMGALSALAKDPIDPNRKWLAYAAGALSPTKSGSFGEELGNALGGMNKALSDQETLRASYIPHVTQALIQAANFQRQRAMDQFMMNAIMNGGGQPQDSTPSQPAEPGQLGSGTYGSIAPPSGMPAVPPQQLRQSGSSSINPMGLPSSLAVGMYLNDPKEYFKTQAGAYTPTELMRTMRAKGIDPSSPQGQQILQENIDKTNYIPPTALRTPIFFNPKTGKTETVPADQLEAGYGAQYRAENRAKSDYQTSQVWDPTANNGNGGFVYKTTTQIADAARGGLPPDQQAIVQTESGGNQNAVSVKGAQGAWQVMPNTQANPGFGVTPAKDNSPQELDRVGHDYYQAMVQRYGNPTLGAIAYNMGPGATDAWMKKGAKFEDLPAETRNYVGKVSTLTALNTTQQQPSQPQNGKGPMAAAPPTGFPKGQEDLQGDLTQKWKPLNEMNGQAQVTSSYLQNIKNLANKAAVGPMSDKIDYANGLLSVAGISEKAKDAVTANDLLDKYSNQIVSRLGTGGLGTDAARSILQSAYPNAHMTKEAINEAADNLIGANEMIKAKAKILQPHYLNRDPVGYAQKEMVFDQNADPRIWQYKAITDPKVRQNFAKQIIAQDPTFPSKIKALEQIGAL